MRGGKWKKTGERGRREIVTEGDCTTDRQNWKMMEGGEIRRKRREKYIYICVGFPKKKKKKIIGIKDRSSREKRRVERGISS